MISKRKRILSRRNYYETIAGTLKWTDIDRGTFLGWDRIQNAARYNGYTIERQRYQSDNSTVYTYSIFIGDEPLARKQYKSAARALEFIDKHIGQQART